MKIRTEKRALDKIYKRRDRYEIPDWQREKVWSKGKKQKLIDSILRGWKLPKFYFQKTSDSPEEYDVVDGQQRLSAIYEFFDNELALSAESEKRFGAKYYRDLTDKISDKFDDFEIEYDEIQDASEKEIKEFFQRLQEGLPLTSSERLNSVDSKLRDFCRTLAKHAFFLHTVSLNNKRYAYFDVAAKAAAIEVEGIEVGLRYEDLKDVFESHNNFSTSSHVAKRLRKALAFLNKALPENSPALKNRATSQSLVTMACRLVESTDPTGKEKSFSKFVDHFNQDLSRQVEMGQNATDPDLIKFQKTINANIRQGPRIRHGILVRKLLQFDPTFMDLFSPETIAASGIVSEVSRVAGEISDSVFLLNEVYGAANGTDLIKPTNKTTSALSQIGKQANSFQSYKTLIENLYFLFWEGPGSKLKGLEPASFKDINELRTALQHDVDHGKSAKAKAKRKKLADTFKKYTGVRTPHTADPELFPILQLNLLTKVDEDLRMLIAHYES